MKDRKRLVHIISSLKMGGAETVLCDIVERLKNTYDQEVIFFHDGPHRARLEQLDIPLHQVRGALCLYDPVFFVRLYRAVAASVPDILHTSLWAANVAGRLMGWLLNIPVVSALHNNVDQNGALRNVLDRLTILLSDKVVAVSDGVADSLLQRDAWLPAQRMSVIPNGIDYDRIVHIGNQQRITRAELGLTDEHFVIGSVGRFEKVKNYPLLLESFALVYENYPHARLVLLGIGPEEQTLRAEVKRLNIEHVVTFVVGKRAYGYYQLFDCFCLSSDKEGISIALLEAMSFSLPCVVTNEEHEHAVLTHDYNGLICPAGDAHHLAQAFEVCMQDQGVAKTLGEHARKTVENLFDIDEMVKKYDHLFDNVYNHQRLNKRVD